MPAENHKTLPSLLLDKNMRWIGALEKSVSALPAGQQKALMAEAGRSCAGEVLVLCEKSLGREIFSIEDLIEGWNLLRSSRNLYGGWVRVGNTVKGLFTECGCPLVRSGLVQLQPARCFCSQNMMETIFSKIARKEVAVEIRQAIGRGDAVCEFHVSY
jgi:hypothetical protein